MNTSFAIESDKIFGLFELDDSGVVRYSRPNRPAQTAGMETSLVGHNFFEEIGFENSSDLRRHFKRFVDSRQAADSFTFDCLFDSEIVTARVMMTRAYETEYCPPSEIVMMDIRKGSY